MIQRLSLLSIMIMLSAICASAQARCRQGFVWREAFPGDYVCVTPEARSQAAQDNRSASGSNDHQFRAGACKQGYVWREADPHDLVCVTPAMRQQTWDDNAGAAGRVVGCRQGFVWREAFPRDYLCVTPEARSQAAQDNQSIEGSNDHQFSPEACRPGFVWREARPQDHVCVTPAVRQQTWIDNASTAGSVAAGRAPDNSSNHALVKHHAGNVIGIWQQGPLYAAQRIG